MIELNLAGDGAWPDLQPLREQEGRLLWNPAPALKIAALSGGTSGGRPSVAIRIDTGLETGPAVVVQEITLRELLTVVDAIKSAYGDPRD